MIINLAETVVKQTLRFISIEALFYLNRGSVSGKQNVRWGADIYSISVRSKVNTADPPAEEP
ncbi:hypothetical protein NXX04_25085 [Bacteroides ovatus]|nr:hypothetical protein [Bacteroides ovatus]